MPALLFAELVCAFGIAFTCKGQTQVVKGISNREMQARDKYSSVAGLSPTMSERP